jgi:outer membrane protein OmpA-like peptidoglycan-associated protein
MNRRTALAVCLALATAIASAAQTSRPAAPRIPLREGLTIVEAYSNPTGDYEPITTVTDIDRDGMTVAVSTDEAVDRCGPRATAPDRRPRSSAHRRVLHEDLENAHALQHEFTACASGPEIHPGTTAIGVSASVLRELTARGQTRLSATTTVAGMVPGTLTRLEPGTVPFTVVVNDERIELAALHARWRSSVGEREYWILDDAANPLILRASYLGKPFLQVVKLSFPTGEAVVSRRIERALTKEGRAVVYGIYFDSASDHIKQESETVLAEIARTLEQNPAWSLAVEGHTDNLGGDALNLDLSTRRANAVKTAVVSRYTVDAKRLRATGYGASRPKDANDTLEGRARNRRVELVKEAGKPADSSEAVPLAKGLAFTTTSHAGLATSAGSVLVADTEAVYSIVGSDDERMVFRFSVSAPSDPAAGKLLDRVPVSLDRAVRREDLRSAARLTIFSSSTDPVQMPGQTFATTSSVVLQTLHDTDKVAFILGINEPEQGLEGLANLAAGARPSAGRSRSDGFVESGVAAMLTSLAVSRHYYRGTLERVGASEPFSVLLDGRRTIVPAVHVRGTLKFNDRTIAPQFWWLDDPSNPLTLKWEIAGLSETVTRIDRPVAGRVGVRDAVAEGMSGKSCRAELSGVYFTTASAQVLDASMPALERFAALVGQHPDWRVTIEGHTDNIGSADYNVELSTRRAAAVREALLRRFGVPASRLQPKGYGLTRPVETNATDEGRAHNRRVEVSRECSTRPSGV